MFRNEKQNTFVVKRITLTMSVNAVRDSACVNERRAEAPAGERTRRLVRNELLVPTPQKRTYTKRNHNEVSVFFSREHTIFFFKKKNKNKKQKEKKKKTKENKKQLKTQKTQP